MKQTYGVNPENGTISICRAKPENRGKGNCKHSEHIKFSDFTNQDVLNYNEKKLEEYYFNQNKDLNYKAVPETITSKNIQTHSDGRILSDQELNQSIIGISDNFNSIDYTLIKNFYQSYHNRLSNTVLNDMYETPAKNIEEFLKSDDPIAKNTREFLGKDVDLENFSLIITSNVKAMVYAEKWTNERRNNPIRRVVLTTIKNDMTKERYIASVMFFGGRCCYCNRVLNQIPNSKSKATGEHITPLNPENPDETPGSTRYGNMALACFACNNERGNKNLNEWIEKTKKIPEENKPAVLNRIKSFRQFALYKEFNEEDGNTINAKINDVLDYVNNFKKNDETMKYSEEDASKISDKVKSLIYDLSNDID